jgi:hypothetical protein
VACNHELERHATSGQAGASTAGADSSGRGEACGEELSVEVMALRQQVLLILHLWLSPCLGSTDPLASACQSHFCGSVEAMRRWRFVS